MAYTQTQKKAHIQELQKYLNAISCYHSEIPSVLPTGVYDSRTVTAVKAFQRFTHLTETGETNQTTWDKIVEVYLADIDTAPQPLQAFPSKKTTVICMGQDCFTVPIIQAILFKLSQKYSNIPSVHVTGIYDTETTQAIQLFQNMCLLPVTGKVDCPTWNMLAQMGCDLR